MESPKDRFDLFEMKQSFQHATEDGIERIVARQFRETARLALVTGRG